MDNVIFLNGRRNGKTTIAKKLNEARIAMGKQKQKQKVYIGADALRDGLKTFGFICKEIQPEKAFTACAGGWTQALIFIDANFVHSLDETVKSNGLYPSLVLSHNETSAELRIFGCSGGGCSGYRIVPISGGDND